MAKKFTEKAVFLKFIEETSASDIERQVVSGRDTYRVADELRDDKEVVLALSKKWKPGFCVASDKLKDDSDFCKEILAMSPGQICNMSDRIKEDLEFAKIAIMGDGNALSDLGDKLRDDDDVVRLALAQNPSSFEYASKRLQEEPEFFMIALDALLAQEGKRYEVGQLVSRAPQNIKAERGIMARAAAKCGRALDDMSAELRDDKDFVLKVLSSDDQEYRPNIAKLSDRLRNDLDVMKAAVEKNSWAMRDAGQELQDNENLIFHCVSVPDAPGNVRGDKIQFCSDRIRGDKTIAMEVLKKSGYAFSRLSEDLKDDPEVLKLALMTGNLYALQDASDRIKNDEVIMLDMLSAEETLPSKVFYGMVSTQAAQNAAEKASPEVAAEASKRREQAEKQRRIREEKESKKAAPGAFKVEMQYQFKEGAWPREVVYIQASDTFQQIWDFWGRDVENQISQMGLGPPEWAAVFVGKNAPSAVGNMADDAALHGLNEAAASADEEIYVFFFDKGLECFDGQRSGYGVADVDKPKDAVKNCGGHEAAAADKPQ
eukprot:TRINITY_DN7036_c1_g1_i1.p1 TRINITY_DN7036_c1_g1~~TRINITY_DN7036_c1_g1_i1.p1  ORF type:complete len:544 (-),score=133.56 TRINITY_DN7036_c1_g1_i1:743-2374(-)